MSSIDQNSLGTGTASGTLDRTRPELPRHRADGLRAIPKMPPVLGAKPANPRQDHPHAQPHSRPQARAAVLSTCLLFVASAAIYVAPSTSPAFAHPSTRQQDGARATTIQIAQAPPQPSGTPQGHPNAREPVHIGTIRTRPGSAATPPAGQDSATPSQSQNPDQLFQEAMNDKRAGRFMTARRNFELLVARHPNAPQAQKARAELAKLYGQDLTGEDGSSTPPSAGEPVPPWSTARRAPDAPVHKINTGLSRAMGIAVGDRVFFAPGSAKLGRKARGVLRDQVNWLKRRKGLIVLVEGHADEPGAPDTNMDLSLRRASAVRDRLVDEGLEPDRIQIQALGHTRPIAQCTSARCSAQNRRVVTRILKSRAGAQPATPGPNEPPPQTH